MEVWGQRGAAVRPRFVVRRMEKVIDEVTIKMVCRQ